MAFATFGGGCFWGVEELFRTLPGIKTATSGYMGGLTENPTYQEVCTGTTGHAEVVHLEYDDSIIDYKSLLTLFFENHNPTQLNRQGPDIGNQYRSSIFFHTQNQKIEAEHYIKDLTDKKHFKDPIVTSITQAMHFWPAEEYHQQYLKKRGLASCHI